MLPYATIDGDRVTVHNIRNFDYRTETDFTPAYYDRTFDLQALDRVDLVAAYWIGPAIAHLFLAFGFGGEHVAISIEARKARDKPYGTLPGFFQQYELVYVVGDERDSSGFGRTTGSPRPRTSISFGWPGPSRTAVASFSTTFGTSTSCGRALASTTP